MHGCSGHQIVGVDPRFEGDDFTQAALTERRARAAHAHGGAAFLTLVGGLLFFGLLKSFHRQARS